MDYLRGDHLRVARPGSLFVHEGIYEGNGYVLHLEKGHRAERVTFAQFAKGGTPEVLSRASSFEEAEERVARAHDDPGAPYDALTNNCEHFARAATTGVPFSPTVRVCVTIGIIGLILWGGSRG
jgi:hypothetical protein